MYFKERSVCEKRNAEEKAHGKKQPTKKSMKKK